METIRNVAAYKEEVEKRGVISFVPNGVSMWPILKNRGQSVIVEKKNRKLVKYDVAFYQRPSGACVLHRVLEVTDDGYVMCGDSQFVLEDVKEEQVFGVMTGFYSKGKYIPSNDPKYLGRVERWYGRKVRRKVKITIFMFFIRVKNKLKRIFGKGRK